MVKKTAGDDIRNSSSGLCLRGGTRCRSDCVRDVLLALALGSSGRRWRVLPPTDVDCVQPMGPESGFHAEGSSRAGGLRSERVVFCFFFI